MNSFTKRLLLMGLAVFGFASFSLALSQAVSYKPWGVPDSRRDDYDRKIEEIDRQAELRDEFAKKPRPSVATTQRSHNFGRVHPGEALTHAFEISNQGNDNLTLSIRETSSDRVKASVKNDTVPPGEATQCVVELTAPQAIETEFDAQSVTVKTNDPLRQILVFNTVTKLRQELVVPQRVEFGSHDITEAATVDFLVYSQRGSHLNLRELDNDSFDVEWGVAEEDPSAGELAGESATTAKRVTVEIEAKDYGQYNDTFDLTFDLDGETKRSTIDFSGRVRAPIEFFGPIVDKRTGISFGTVESDKQHDLFVVVRSRAEASRPIKVLDVEPKELETELQPLKTEGSYRLRISIPKGCPYRRFNLDSKHGYVQVGDPMLNSYSGTLPVFGVVGDFQND